MSVAVGLASAALVGTLASVPSRSGARRPWRASGRSGPMIWFDQTCDRMFSALPFDTMISTRALGRIAVVAAAMSIVSPVSIVVAFLGVAVISTRRRRARRISGESRVARGLPNVIDLLVMSVGAGLTPRLALASSAPWLPDPFGAAAAEVERRAASGESFATAIDIVFESLGPEVRPLTTTLIAAHTDGAALMPALKGLGDEARRRQRVAAEDRARRVPVAMLFPLVVCVLPAFALLTVVPLLIGTLSGLQLPG